MPLRRFACCFAFFAALCVAPVAAAQAPPAEPPPAPPPAAAPPASPAGEPVPAQAPAEQSAPVPPPPPPPTTPPPTQLPPPPPEAPPAPADAVPMGFGAETHNGFYFRFSLGAGGMSMQREAKGTAGSELVYTGDSSISGGVTTAELSIGGTPGGGLAIAGTLLTYSLPDPTLEPDVGEDVELGGSLDAIVLGASVDWFPNPNGGFHFGGTLGLAGASAETPDNSAFEHLGGVGVGLSAQVGYDWWVGEEWSLGVQGRLTALGLKGEATANVAGVEVTGEETDAVSAFTIAITLLYH